MAERKLLLASGNPGKIRELRDLLAELRAELVTPAQLGLQLEVPEKGQTYAENAAGKALAYARAAGLVAIADDTGLEVEALGGRPGLYSARFSPEPGATDADRRRLLLAQLRHRERPWKARFRCVVAVATPGGRVGHAEGVCLGEIIPAERGRHGFGYDPIFLLAEAPRTMAELDPEEKNRRSHRGRAVRAAMPIIREYLAQEGGPDRSRPSP